MAKIRSQDTKPEEYIRKQLFHCGYRYRKNVNTVPGHPDAWFPKYNTALFVHGCFWHHHEGCKYAYMPKSRIEFWKAKFQRNTERDAIVKEQLKERRNRFLIIWECTVRKMMKSESVREKVIREIVSFLESDNMNHEI